MARLRGRHAVFICRTPVGWKPTSPNAVPPEILSARSYSRRMPLFSALAATREWNKAHLTDADGFGGEWAVCIVSTASGGPLRRLSWRESRDAFHTKGE